MDWSNQSLGDYCEVIAGQSPEGKYYNADGQGLPFYQGKKEFGDRFIGAPQKWTTKVTKEALAGDILMSVRAPVGPINFSSQKICIGRGLAAIRPSEKLNKDFLFYYLLSKQDEIIGNEGAVFASINKSQIESLSFSYVNLEEQKRIVALLDTVFADLEQTGAKTVQNLKNARELFDSYLQQVFSQKGEGWLDKRLEDVLLDKPRNGWSPPAKNHSDIGTPVLTLSSVTGFRFNKYKVKFTSAVTKVNAHYWVNNGDLLITRSNTPALVGHVAICSNIAIPTIYPDLIMKLKLDIGKVDTKFIYYQLRSERLRKIITSSAQGANPTMKKINQGIVQSLPIRHPSIESQKEIVLRLDSIYETTIKLEKIYRNKLDNLNELKKSILEKAFSGELTAEAR
jgi:type I restriction enzyme S subunit